MGMYIRGSLFISFENTYFCVIILQQCVYCKNRAGKIFLIVDPGRVTAPPLSLHGDFGAAVCTGGGVRIRGGGAGLVRFFCKSGLLGSIIKIAVL